jgi:hypothetical protein
MPHHLTRDISDLLEARANNGHGASRYVEVLFAKIIAALRRDPRFATITLFELELLLADERNEAEKFLFNALRDRVQLDDAIDAVHRCLGAD